MRRMYDVLFLPAPAPVGYDVAAGYLASPGIHDPWSADDWRRAAGSARFLLPIAGYWTSTITPTDDAASQRAQLDGLGFPRGIARALDVEHAVAQHAHDVGYLSGWAHAVANEGDVPIMYCSLTDAHLMPATLTPAAVDVALLWVAHWTNVPHLAPGTAATQYASPTSTGTLRVDESLVADGVPLYDLRPTAPNGGNPMADCVAIIAHPSGRGYWEVGADGAVFAYGVAVYHGGANALPNGAKLNAPIKSAAATPDGLGYWLVADDFAVYAFGTAAFYGHASAPAAVH